MSLRGAAAGGSCRIPASVTGVLGFRPTTGCWPAADGIVPMSTTRDTVGAPRDPRRMHAHPVMGWACPSLPADESGHGGLFVLGQALLAPRGRVVRSPNAGELDVLAGARWVFAGESEPDE